MWRCMRCPGRSTTNWKSSGVDERYLKYAHGPGVDTDWKSLHSYNKLYYVVSSIAAISAYVFITAVAALVAQHGNAPLILLPS